MKNKKLIVAVAALVAVIVLMGGIFLATRPDTVAGGKNVTVTVVHKDGTQRVFEYATDAEYLGEVLLEAGLIEGEEGAYGLYVKVVDGERADYELDGAFWAFYEGAESALQGIDQTPVADGAVYRLVYTYG